MAGNNERLPLLNTRDGTADNLFSEATLVWSNICVEQSSPSVFRKLSNSIRNICEKDKKIKPRLLLNNLSGIARPGEILAIMGTSGVGKTTLLKILSGHYGDNLKLSRGNVYLNDYLTTEAQRQKGIYIGYAEQQESFIETITIEEHIIFQAMVHMSNKLSDNERRLIVKNIIKKLHLTKCINTIIDKLSGGERKRLALASALLIEPPVILIDEPTSGLDTYLAKSLINIINLLAIERNRTIIIVIHQPTSSMLKLMDKICVLVESGSQAFFGTKTEAINFFTNQCKLSASSLDGFIEQLAAPSEALTTEDINKQHSAADIYSKSHYFKSLELEIDNHIQINNENNLINKFDKNYRSNFLRQLKWLLWRSFLADLRNPVRTTYLLVRAIIPAILYGLISYQLCSSDHFIQNVSAVNRSVVSLTINTGAYMILGTMIINNHIGIRENRRGLYGIFPYYLSVVIHDLPTLILCPFISNTCIYWMTGMDYTWTHYASFIGTTILQSNMGAAIGLLFSSFSSSIESVFNISTFILQTLAIYNGFYFSLKQIPSILHTFSYISPYYYSYMGLSILQWGTKDHKNIQQCDHSQKSIYTTKSIKRSTFSSDFDLCRQILEHIDMRDLFQNINLIIFIMFIIVFICHFISFIALWIRAHKSTIMQLFFKND